MMRRERADRLVGQFVLSQRPADLPPGWSVRERQGWALATHSKLPVAEVVTPGGAPIGWIAGFPVGRDAVAPPRVEFPESAGADPAALEAALYRLGGRFVGVFLTDRLARVYLDPCGSLAAVYSEARPAVAATPSLLDGAEHPWDEPLIRLLGMPESGQWYPFGLTPRAGVRRLIPNHFLDLRAWAPQRHWPSGPIAPDERADAAVQRILDTIRATIATVARAFPLHMSLTAGRDSRLLLACAREQLGRVRFFTFGRERETADTHIARKLARRFGLDHAILPIEPARPEQAAAWLERVGYCVSGDIARSHPTLRHLDPRRALLPGMAGEVGRAFYWRDGDGPATRLSAEDVVARCALPAGDRIAAAAARWLAELSDQSAFTILDLLYVEQRLGCWGGPQQYGGDEFSACQLFPLAHRDIFAATLALPAGYRLGEQLVLDACRASWPELLDYPFNEFAGLQRYPRRIAKSVYYAGRRALAGLRRR